MAIDWDRLVVESEHNGVIASAGEVALLVGADAAGVTWGNITGDVTQQADLMALVDGYATLDSPQFTGTPRTVTPPAGNNSTRIASTAFVKGAIDSLGALAKKDKADYRTDISNKPTLGSLASKDYADYQTEVVNKPTLGALAALNSISYTSNKLTDKPTLGEMAAVDDVPASGITSGACYRTRGKWMRLDNPVYFVDGTNGNDNTGDGSSQNPFKTIQKAVDSILFTGQVYITSGTYNEKVSIGDKRVSLYPDDPPNGVPQQAADIVTRGIHVYNFGELMLVGNFKIINPDAQTTNSGYLSVRDGSTLIHSVGKLTVDKPWSYPIVEYWDRHAIWVENSTMCVSNLDVTFGQYEGSAILVSETGRFFADRIWAQTHSVTGILFELYGGMIQYNTIVSGSVYPTLYVDNTDNMIIGGNPCTQQHP